MAGSTGQPQPSSNPNVNTTSANAFNTSVGATQGQLGYQPQTLGGMDMSQYQNPYQQNVIDNSLNDMERSRQMQMNNIGAQATQAGAFGGSRHGVVEAETNAGFGREAGNLSALMRSQGWDQAQNAARFDIGMGLAGSQNQLAAANQLGGLSQLGFGMGQTLNNNMMQQGAMQQMQQQQLIDAAKMQYGGFTGSPYQALQTTNSALQSSPTGQGSTTEKSNPGLLGYLSAGAGLASAICWVAREVYGPADPKWLQFREYMLTIAPKWLLSAYTRHGEALAGVVRRHPALKRLLRPLMDMGRRKAGY